MWNNGQHIQEPRNSLKELEAVKGPLEMEAAQIWFAKFCLANPSFALQLLTGVEIAPIQDLLIRSFFLRNYSLMIAGRGFSKTFTISLFIVLYAIAYPGSKIGICSGTFRQSKNVYKQIEKFLNGPKGAFLRQCMKGEPGHANEAYVMTIGTTEVFALPLTEKIRGYRFNCIVIDELLLVDKSIIDNVIKPFLTVKHNASPERERIIAAEDKLIAAGKLDPKDRTQYPSNKIIGLSSASFKFESLYQDQFLPYMTAIHDKNAEGINHCLFQLSYEAAPTWLLDDKAIKDAKRTNSEKIFDKEYRAIFIDESDGYFSAQKIEEAQFGITESPKLCLIGDPSKKYILSIDPNYHSAETADFFAMIVTELNDDEKSGTVVHLYAMPIGDISERTKYLNYILNWFNIVYIIVDHGGGPKFIEDSKLFLNEKFKNIETFEPDFSNEQEIKESRKRYNLHANKILHVQYFGESGWGRMANENLANMIEKKTIRFGARVYFDDEYAKIRNLQTLDVRDLSFFGKDKLQDNTKPEMCRINLIDSQEELLKEMKAELLLIQPTATASGDQKFDMNKGLADRNNPNRPRKDLYSALLMGSWAVKCYYDLFAVRVEESQIIRPFFIGKR